MGDSRLELKVENDLVLREFSFEDVDVVVSLIENNKHYLFPYDSDVLSDTRDIHVDYLHRIIAESKNNTKKGFGIWLNAEHIGAVIVSLGTEKKKINDNVESFLSAELGYYLGENFQGKGYALKCVKRIVFYCFEDLKVQKITGLVRENNYRSIRILEKCNFVKSEIKSKLKNEEAYTILYYINSFPTIK